jgi:hypothetical protein
MNGLNDNNQAPDLRCLPSLCRGIYNRVAQKVGCDPSYVSRVARGERTSEAVSEALRAEIQLTWAKVNEAIAESTENAPKRKTRAASTRELSRSKTIAFHELRLRRGQGKLALKYPNSLITMLAFLCKLEGGEKFSAN